MKTIGLIAGSGKFPILFAQEAKKRQTEVIAIAVKGDTLHTLAHFVKKINWIDISDFDKISAIFKTESVNQVAMAGQINPRRLFNRASNFGPQLSELLARLKDKRADTIFSAIADKLKESGIELLSSLIFLSEYLPKKSVLTKRVPSEAEWQDIHFGLDMVKKIAGLDIGQAIVIKQKAVLAVEALEGTDFTILRGGLIGRGGAVVVKVSKPRQDLRFDVPVVGLRTIRVLIKAGISCLAIEAEKTLFLDRDESLALANRKGIAIAAV